MFGGYFVTSGGDLVVIWWLDDFVENFDHWRFLWHADVLKYWMVQFDS